MHSHEEILALHQRFQSKRFAKEVDVSLESMEASFYGALATMALSEMMTWSENTSPEYRHEVRRAFDKTPSTQQVATIFVMTQEWQARGPRRITLSLTLSMLDENWLNRLSFTLCLKEMGRMKSRPSTDTASRWSRKREKPIHR